MTYPKARTLAKDLSLGLPRDNMLAANPHLADAWEIYTLCRHQEIITVEKTKQSAKGTVKNVQYLPKTLGYRVLPWDGGVLDQPHALMSIFASFQMGEGDAFVQRLQSS
jgi:hypothetical protein